MKQTFICNNYSEMSEKATSLVTKIIKNKDGKFFAAFSGGNGVKGFLELLSQKKVYWKLVHLFLADERIVPINSEESNYKLINDKFASKVKGLRFFPFDVEEGLKRYDKTFFSVCNGKLDLIVLSVGSDGHIASIFPHSKELKSEKEGYLFVDDSPKPPKNRITLSPNTIQKANSIVLIFGSEEKRKAFENFESEKVSIEECPAKLCKNANNLLVLTSFGEQKA
ncbi:MAG: 6-phosphogluconolactonase [Candidatus Diapherotrites archaeon]